MKYFLVLTEPEKEVGIPLALKAPVTKGGELGELEELEELEILAGSAMKDVCYLTKPREFKKEEGVESYRQAL